MTDELDKIIDDILSELVFCGRDSLGVTDEAVLARKGVKALIADQMIEYQSQLLKDYKDDIAKECNKARIEEMKLAKEWCSGAYLCDYVNILDRIKELSNKENK